jgi:hypothetical protein
MKLLATKNENVSSHKILACLLVVFGSANVAAQGSLCRAEEESVWSCEAKAERFELCASKDIGSSSGYMQYRSSTNGKLVFQYPTRPQHPLGIFESKAFTTGVRLQFNNGGFAYDIAERMPNGDTSINITAPDGKNSVISCSEDYSFTLTLTSTIELFKKTGIWR